MDRHALTGPAGAAGLLLLALLTGCHSAAPAATSANSTRATSATLPSPAQATSGEAAAAASAAAVALVPTYLAALDELYSNPRVGYQKLYAVAVSPEASVQIRGIGGFRGRGWRQTGAAKLLRTTVTKVTVPGAPTRTHPVTVHVRACVDVGAIDVKDAKGRSVATRGAPRYLIERLVVINVNKLDPSGWRVQDAPNQQARSCAG
jgi:hypothetical protein